MTLVDDLIQARALIDTPEKWRKDDRDSGESCCAAIAISRVTRRDGRVWGEFPCWRALYCALPAEWKEAPNEVDDPDEEPGEAVGRFNDHPDTTHADIMALFDRAIALMEGRDNA